MSDHDPFETFKATMSTSGTLHPLPAHEVRRRGDRLRRRNTALTVAGGTVAALVAVGVPVALTQTGGTTDGDSGLVATQGPSTDAVAWRVDIPANFPLTAGMPETNGHDGSPVVAREGYEPQVVGPCSGPAWDVSDALDSLSAVYTGETEGGQDRVLSVFEDEAAARARVDALAAEAASCTSDRVEVLGYQQVVEDGADVVRFVNGYDTGEGVLHQASRVGNAVLYETTYFNGARDDTAVTSTLENAAEDRARVLDAMCVFAADPC